jgi:hypothetical protein
MKRMKPLAVLLAMMIPAAPVAVAIAAEPTAPATPEPATARDQAATKRIAASARRHKRAKRHNHRKLARVHFRLVRQVHGKVSRTREARVHAWSNPRLRRANHTLRRRLNATRPSGTLVAIANCESHGNPRAIGGGGAFRGKYQFDYGTWASVGGKGDPASAPEAEQDRRAALLYARAGASPWPVCGR